VIDVPGDINEIYGTKQRGGFVEVMYPVLKRKMLLFENAVINVNLRGEKIDYIAVQKKPAVTCSFS